MTATGATDFTIATLRARRTDKWHKFPADVLPAWVADMDFGVAPAITEALTRLTREPGIRLCSPRGRAGRRLCPPHGGAFRLARRSRRHARDRRPGAGQLLLGHGVQ